MCRRRNRHRASSPHLSAASTPQSPCCASCCDLCEPNDAADDFIPPTTASVAEFYTEPMLPHIGDVDVLFHRSTELAIPRGHPLPTKLPDEFYEFVSVVEITDSHLPGYVYLELRHLLTEGVDDCKYNAVEYDREMYASNCCYRGDVSYS